MLGEHFRPGHQAVNEECAEQDRHAGAAGTPNATVGTSAPPSRALVALSAAMTPRTSPVPKVCAAPFSVRSAWP